MSKIVYDDVLSEMASSGWYRVTRAGRIETCRKWNGHEDVEVDWYSCEKDDGKGYRYISYRMSRVKAHRLAYLLHHGLTSLNGKEINHLDGDRLNNRKSNLELCDAKRQSDHAYEIGLNPAKGKKNHNAKMTAARVKEARKLREMGVTYVAIAKRFGVTPRVIRLICIGQAWKHVK